MLHLHTPNNLHFYTIVLLLQIALSICRRSPLAPLFHQRRLAVLAPSLYAYSVQDRRVDEWRKTDDVVCHAEVEYPKAGVLALVRRGLYDSVDGCLVKPAGEELQGVSSVYDLTM